MTPKDRKAISAFLRVQRRDAMVGRLIQGSHAHVGAIQRLLENMQSALSDGSLRAETDDERESLVAIVNDMQASANRAFDVLLACYF